MKKFLIRTLSVLCIIYIAICALLYFYQEHMIFFPEKMDKNAAYNFEQKFEEVNVKTKDGTNINSVLFRADTARGVIFYLHGNGGCINSWSKVTKAYTDLGYDVLMTDYRGYGKSEGVITGQEQLYNDVQAVYTELKKRYDENKMIVLGYSIGTGPAAKIASINSPKLLILQAPYYSLTDMMLHTYPIIPTFLLKYKFTTNEYIPACKMPVVIFHGTSDEVIYYNSSVKLKEKFKPADTLITLQEQGHNGMTDNTEYLRAVQWILGR